MIPYQHATCLNVRGCLSDHPHPLSADLIFWTDDIIAALVAFFAFRGSFMAYTDYTNIASALAYTPLVCVVYIMQHS